MTIQDALTKLTELEKTLLAYHHAAGVMMYDGETVAPPNSAAGRGETMALLGGVEHRLLTAPETKEIAETLLGGAGVSARDRRRAELLKEQADALTLVPEAEYADYQRLLAEAGGAWHRAKPANDYKSFAPYLTQIIDFNRRMAARKDASKPAYDALLDIYEKGLTIATLDPFFETLRVSLTPLILAVAECPQPEAPFMRETYPEWQQRAFTDRLMAFMGLNRDDCSIGETEHPFTDGFNKHDVRITTHYHPEDVTLSMYSVIHEGGHALYELGMDDDLQGTLLNGGTAMSIHESQSRFYENLIGRSLPFCEALTPILREYFPKQTAGLDAETLYRCVNRAQPSLIRTEADELTYPMHIMIRYELEKRMLSGDLTAGDIPAAWNEMYKKYLGIDVPNDTVGCLQDTHWASGLVGYFPSYALGSAYGAQMLDAMQKDIDVWTPVRQGNLAPVTDWLREKIHRHGQIFTPQQALFSACGAAFDPKYYIDYLTRKFTALYGL